jgi:hypothetical protein
MALLYIHTRVSDKERKSWDSDERTADARAGEIVASHKLQILCENEPRGVLQGNSVTYRFLHKGRPDIPIRSACHAHAGSVGSKWQEVIDH